MGSPVPSHPPLAAWILTGLLSQVQALTVLGWQLQRCGAGLSHGEESVGDVGQKAIEVQKLPPSRFLLWAPQQHRYHAGEELLAPSLWWLPPRFRLLWDQEIPFPAGLTELQEHTEVETGFLALPPSLPTKVSPTHKLPQIKEIPHFRSGAPPIWEVARRHYDHTVAL